MVPDDLVELGQISGAYGIKGWVRVRAYSTDSQTLLQAKKWWLKAPAQKGAGVLRSKHSSLSQSYQPLEVANVREHSGQIVAQLSTVSDRNAAEKLKSYEVWVPRADFVKSDPNEYYWVDLIGCLLYGENSNNEQTLIGEVVGLMDNGAHGILRVARIKQTDNISSGSKHDYVLNDKGRVVEELVPFVEAHVHTVDLKTRTLISNWSSD